MRCPVTTFDCISCDTRCQLTCGNDRRADRRGLDDGPLLPGHAPRKRPLPKPRSRMEDTAREIRQERASMTTLPRPSREETLIACETLLRSCLSAEARRVVREIYEREAAK